MNNIPAPNAARTHELAVAYVEQSERIAEHLWDPWTSASSAGFDRVLANGCICVERAASFVQCLGNLDSRLAADAPALSQRLGAVRARLS